MRNFEDELESNLRSMKFQEDPEANERIMSNVRQWILESASGGWASRLPVKAAAGGLATSAALVAVLSMTNVFGLGSGNSPSHLPPMAKRQVDGLEGRSTELGKPCPEAIHAADPSSLRSAAAPLWLPPKAGSWVATDSWKCGADGAPVVVFGGIVVSYETMAPNGQDEGGPIEPGWGSRKYLQAWADALGGGAYVDTIQGRPALVRPASSSSNNSVVLVVDNTLVRVVAKPPVSIDTILALAASLQLPAK